MPNSQRIESYPTLLFDAFHKAAGQEPVRITCDTHTRATTLRSYAYTLRKLLRASPEDWHQQLASLVNDMKFYVDGTQFIIAPPMYTVTQGAHLENPSHDNPA